MLFNYIKNELVNELDGSPVFRKVEDNLFCFDYSLQKIAFDILIGKDNVAIDLVLRKGAFGEVLLERYPSLSKTHKVRISTLKKEVSKDFISIIMNREFNILANILVKNSQYLISPNRTIYFLNEAGALQKEAPIKMYFSDPIANFGDFITPWIASKLTSRPVLNVHDLKASTGAIFGVGSIIDRINHTHQKCKIWGSGLISDHNIDLVMRRLKSANIELIAAVRGKITEKYLLDYGFNVNKVYGDPALIFSRLHNPRQVSLDYKKVIIPHYKHLRFFKDLNLKGYHIVDVAGEVSSVVDQISAADAVISTSMHGLILSQSYGIPWVHLHMTDALHLIGDDFKFHDFFSTLDQSKVTQKKILQRDISQETIDQIINTATLPSYSKDYSEEAIIDAFYQCI